MISVINHEVRKQLNISSVHYLIAHTCAQYKELLIPTGVSEMAESLGLSHRAVSVAMDDLKSCYPAILEKHETGSYYPSRSWYISHFEVTPELTTKDHELAKEVIDFFNEINQTKYQVNSNVEMVKKIIKSNPKITLQHFKSVILHKFSTWGLDEKMKEYNRPSTIFSNKFMKYLDDANHYWIQIKKNDQSTIIFGN
jgi:uncharacterized phage protein (TIGR02220 family)